ncbi:MAG: hypothetical protein ACPGQL_11215, partial [Thermoplasmatota archaeon]
MKPLSLLIAACLLMTAAPTATADVGYYECAGDATVATACLGHYDNEGDGCDESGSEDRYQHWAVISVPGLGTWAQVGYILHCVNGGWFMCDYDGGDVIAHQEAAGESHAHVSAYEYGCSGGDVSYNQCRIG